MGMGRTKGSIPSTLQQGGPADMPGGDSLAAPGGFLSAARCAALEQQGWQEGCSTRGSPVAPEGPHTSPVVQAWGTLRAPSAPWGAGPQGRAALRCCGC